MASEFRLKGLVSLNDSQFQKGIRRVEEKTKGMARAVGSELKGFLTAPLTQAAGAVAGFLTYQTFRGGIGGALAAGDSIYQLSKRMTVAADQTAALSEEFEVVTGNSEDVGSSINKMQRAIAGGSEQFARLGINYEKLRSASPVEQFEMISKAINGLTDPTRKTAAAMEVFGKSGGELESIFEEVAKSGVPLTASARLLGDNAEKFHESSMLLRGASFSLKGLFVGITAEIVDPLNDILKQINAHDFSELGRSIGAGVATASYFVKGMLADFNGFTGQLGGALSKGFQGLFSMRSAGALWDGLKFGLLGALKSAAGGLVDALADAFKLVDFVKQGVLWGEQLFDGMMKSPKLKGILSFFAPAEPDKPTKQYDKPPAGSHITDGMLRSNFAPSMPLLSGVGPGLNEAQIPDTTTMEPGSSRFMPPVPVSHAPAVPETFTQKLHEMSSSLNRGGSDFKTAADAFRSLIIPLTDAAHEIAGIFGKTTAKGKAAVQSEAQKKASLARSEFGELANFGLFKNPMLRDSPSMATSNADWGGLFGDKGPGGRRKPPGFSLMGKGSASLLARGAYDQRGGAGSLSGMTGEDFAKDYSPSDRLMMLASHAERLSMMKAASAGNSGGHMAALGGAWGAIHAGDKARHKAYLKEQAIRDAGGGTELQLLGDISSHTKGMLDTWTK